MKRIIIIIVVALLVGLGVWGIICRKQIAKSLYGEHSIEILNITQEDGEGGNLYSSSSKTLLNVGFKYKIGLKVTNLVTNEEVIDANVSWKSSDKSIIEVVYKENGYAVIRAYARGECELKVSYRGSEAVIPFSVDEYVSSIDMEENSQAVIADIELGQTVNLNDLVLWLYPYTCTIEDLDFTVYDEIDSVGNIIANEDYIKLIRDEGFNPIALQGVGIGEAMLRISSKIDPTIYKDFEMSSDIDDPIIKDSICVTLLANGSIQSKNAPISETRITSIREFRFYGKEISGFEAFNVFKGLEVLVFDNCSGFVSYDFSPLVNLRKFEASYCEFRDDSNRSFTFNNEYLTDLIITNSGLQSLTVKGSAFDCFEIRDEALVSISMTGSMIKNLSSDGVTSTLDISYGANLKSITLDGVTSDYPIGKVVVGGINYFTDVKYVNMHMLESVFTPKRENAFEEYVIDSIHVDGCERIALGQDIFQYKSRIIELKNLATLELKMGNKAVRDGGRVIFNNVSFGSADLSQACISELEITGGEKLGVVTFDNDDPNLSKIVLPRTIYIAKFSNCSAERVDLKNADRLVSLSLNEVTDVTSIYVSDADFTSNGAFSVNLAESGTEQTMDVSLINCHVYNLEAITISNAHKVKKLNLSQNELRHFDVSHYINADSIDLSHNQIFSITGINLSLVELNASHNQLETVGEISRCANIQVLDLSYNNIVNVLGLKDLSSLVSLRINNNAFMQLDNPELLGVELALRTINTLTIGSTYEFSDSCKQMIYDVIAENGQNLTELTILEPEVYDSIFKEFDKNEEMFAGLESIKIYTYNEIIKYNSIYGDAEGLIFLDFSGLDALPEIQLLEIPLDINTVCLIGDGETVYDGISIISNYADAPTPLKIILEDMSFKAISGYSAIFSANRPITIEAFGDNEIIGVGANDTVVTDSLSIKKRFDSTVNLKVTASDGFDATGYGEDGKNGRNAISTYSFECEITRLELVGGKGGNGRIGSNNYGDGGKGGDGGNGGYGLSAVNATILNTEVHAIAGAGGNGGEGGTPLSTPRTPGQAPSRTVGYTGSTGYRGGNGGNGGNSGRAIWVEQTLKITESKFLLEEANSGAGATGGSGGKGGQGGQGGNGRDAVLFSKSGTDGARGGTGGRGGQGGNGGNGGVVYNALACGYLDVSEGDLYYLESVFTTVTAEDGNGSAGEGGLRGFGGQGGKRGKGIFATYSDGRWGYDGSNGMPGNAGAPRTHE